MADEKDTPPGTLNFEARRLQAMASNHRELKAYVDYITQHLQDNERLFARLFALEAQLLSAADPEDVCLALLRGLRSNFELDMVRLWFDRESFVGQYPFHGLSSQDLVWVEKNEIAEVGLAHQAVWLVQLAKGEHFVWLEKHDERLKSMALLLLGPLDRPYGVIGLGSLDATRFDPEQGTDFLQHLAQVCGLMLENTVSRERMARMMLKDRHSGAHNQRFFQPYSHQPLSQWFGRNIPVACLSIYVDASAQGSPNLATLSHTITALIRHQDIIIRHDEHDTFIVFLPGVRPLQDVDIAENIAEACRQLQHEDGATPIALSMGVALSSHDEDPAISELLKRAEQAMQQAIEAGGDTLICAAAPSAAS
jgi:uncharacterized protein YigA (DUF484 family)/GGDEF domain-containing protein